jgi:AraC-like DNA-binding protein
MAGFSDQTTGPDDVRVVPPPAVMVVVDIGGGLLVGDASGRQQRGSVVAGLAPVGAALVRRQETSRAVDPEVAFAWRQLVASGGQVRVELLAAEAGWSRKRLWSRFRSQIGLTPKRAARLVRFDRAARLLAAGRSAAAVAADSGYADQSHLHRDVLAFAGMTPAAMAVTPFLAVDDVAWPGAMSAART